MGISSQKLNALAQSLEGELHFDALMRTLYATDASVYRELPLAVAFPKHTADVKRLIRFAREEKTSLIPRTAGTSLAGQCVGEGIVVDVSRHMNQILEVNEREKWVRVQPGVIRDELNRYLRKYGLFFGPNTSTANRAMLGGMVGNNSCGSYSIIYGTTRDHVLELTTLLSDGSDAIFGPLTAQQFKSKPAGTNLENTLYREILKELSSPENRDEIRREFHKPEIHRRNTGYAVDVLMASAPFDETQPDFNFCKLLAGSEGTLAFTTEIKLNLVPLPPKHALLVCVHFNSIDEALNAVLVVNKFRPRAVELMDKMIMNCTKGNIEHEKNRFFVNGDPEAMLIIEFGAESTEEADAIANTMIYALQEANLGYDFPKVYPPHIEKVWDLRMAGLGLLSNFPGDAKPVAVIEDTAVDVNELPQYIREFTEMMSGFGQSSVYYAHAGAGELHLRPLLNLKDEKDIRAFKQIGKSSAELVKKYNGSLSGEHGDGRVRAGFIPYMIGEKNYQLLRRIKYTWDPDNIFNPGKIVDAAPMETSLRYKPGQVTREFDTALDFSDTEGILRMAEKCNGSGDCRKLSGGTMCPSYRATRNEKDTTRARANILREFLTNSPKPNAFDHKEIKEVMSLCLSCKGCKSECPSSVDVAALKAEFLHQYYKSNGVPFRAKAIANIGTANKFASNFSLLSNFFLSNPLTSSFIKKIICIAPERSFPLLYKTTLRQWFKQNKDDFKVKNSKGKVWFFCDEFTNYNDVEIGIKAIRLLTRLGYEVAIPRHVESGRAYISKGLLKEAQTLAWQNIEHLKDIVSEETPLIGIEPSAILGFRDEYLRLANEGLLSAAKNLGKCSLLVDEFIAGEIKKGKITSCSFTKDKMTIKLHGHCHQKALSSIDHSVSLLSLPENYTVEAIPSGCCGMAGSFGYEAGHYKISMAIGEQVLFPAVRNKEEHTIIAAPGTSCRHQIFDGTGVHALHPVEVLHGALKDEA